MPPRKKNGRPQKTPNFKASLMATLNADRARDQNTKADHRRPRRQDPSNQAPPPAEDPCSQVNTSPNQTKDAPPVTDPIQTRDEAISQKVESEQFHDTKNERKTSVGPESPSPESMDSIPNEFEPHEAHTMAKKIATSAESQTETANPTPVGIKSVKKLVSQDTLVEATNSPLDTTLRDVTNVEETGDGITAPSTATSESAENVDNDPLQSRQSLPFGTRTFERELAQVVID
ncbi:hypothetical protein HDU76_005466, partial [Blyttiomyces sp. JEL0837]